ncbi:ATP-dependent RNA helicase Prp11 [Phlyctochytrium arcticum]|nr:ATP-dependent RNA helicase Prp11 [Phlyctochytrium arcticum]
MARYRSRSRSRSPTSGETTYKRRKQDDEDRRKSSSFKDPKSSSSSSRGSRTHKSDQDRDRDRDRDRRRSRERRSSRDRDRERSSRHSKPTSKRAEDGEGELQDRREVTEVFESSADVHKNHGSTTNGKSDENKEVPPKTPVKIETSTTTPSKTPDKPVSSTPTPTDAEEKLRLRKERLEQWKRERAAKEAAEKAKADTATGADMVDVKVTKSEEAKTEPIIAASNTPVIGVKPTVKASIRSTTSTMKTSGKPITKASTKLSFGRPKSGTIVKAVIKSSAPKQLESKLNMSLDNDDDEGPVGTRRRRLKAFDDDIGVQDNTTGGAEPMVEDNAEEEGEDALEAFMADVTTEVKKLNEDDLAAQQQQAASMLIDGEDAAGGDDDDEEEAVDEDEDLIAAAAKKLAAKRKDLAPVNHSTMTYEPFRKKFYIEPPELATLSPAEVDAKRLELDGIKIRGVKCPKPIEKWTQFGLPGVVGQVISRVLKYERPSPIQAQAIPAVMSGRDVIGIAKTGSGKTIAFLLPMLRHIKDQRPLEAQEGPIALIMTPTRELAVQIHKECRHFAKAMNLRAVCCYGGSPIKDQIAELKRGAEIIICTPGRMIDLLCANSGRVTNLKRVTYMVLDEADRMFDMGFEPQVMRIVNNVRPDRQTILFSATFPRKMEALARKILKSPLEITVGGRSVVASDVSQIVEVLPDDNAKFLRLLDILGRTFNEAQDVKVLIFTDRQEAADNLLTLLLRKGYPCQSLHGGKDQADRDSTIADFKTGNTNILIATSVAARGLDVKQLKVVINYECPNHMEDYVHRVGRTGRAGQKGTAYTFITPDQDRFAVDILKALTMSEVPIPADLQNLADSFMEKVKTGAAQYNSSGFGGKGLEKLEKERDIVKKIQKRAHGAAYEEDEEEEEEVEVKFEAKSVAGGGDGSSQTPAARAAQEAAAKVNAAVGTTGAARARDIIAEINAKFKDAAATHPGAMMMMLDDKKQSSDAAFAYEIEINDYPQKARWRVTNKEQISQITELSGAAITTRGTYFAPGKQPTGNERKLYLFIEGDSQLVIDKAKVEIKRIITEATIASMESEAAGGARYSVV